MVESVHQYGTRQVSKNDIFVTHKSQVQYGLRSVRYFGAKCWNDILVDIKVHHHQSLLLSRTSPGLIKLSLKSNLTNC